MNGNIWRPAVFPIGRMMQEAGLACGFLALLILLFSGCSHEQPKPTQADVKGLVHKEISDPVRADKVAALLARLDAEIAEQMKAREANRNEFVRLNQDYNSTPEQFDRYLEKNRKVQEQNRARIMETYFKIKENTTPQEWEAICKPEMQSLTDMLHKMEETGNK